MENIRGIYFDLTSQTSNKIVRQELAHKG